MIISGDHLCCVFEGCFFKAAPSVVVAGEQQICQVIAFSQRWGVRGHTCSLRSSLSSSFSASFIRFSNSLRFPCKNTPFFLYILCFYSFFLFFLSQHHLIFFDLYIFVSFIHGFSYSMPCSHGSLVPHVDLSSFFPPPHFSLYLFKLNLTLCINDV